jgi:hypothetical protein
MPDIWLDVDVAIASMSVNKYPITGLDGVSLDETVAYNEAGIDVNWNFQTTAGVFTQTNVVPTQTGVHDWLHAGNSMYTIELPDTGGTVNNDTEGFGWWSGKATDIAAFISPVYGFRAAALNNALIDGGDDLDVNVTKIADTAQTAYDIGQGVSDMHAGIIMGTCGSTSLTNTTCSSDLTGYTIDQLVGRVITFLGGDADGESTDITAYAVTNGVITFTSLSGAIAPANTDPFKIT